MANKRLELVSRDSNDELNIAGDKDISQRDKMYSCTADVVDKKCTSVDDGACGDVRTFIQRKKLTL